MSCQHEVIMTKIILKWITPLESTYLVYYYANCASAMYELCERFVNEDEFIAQSWKHVNSRLNIGSNWNTFKNVCKGFINEVKWFINYPLNQHYRDGMFIHSVDKNKKCCMNGVQWTTDKNIFLNSYEGL